MRTTDSGQVLLTRKRDFEVASTRDTVQRIQGAAEVFFDRGPTRGWQNQDGQLSDRKVLLISQVLVRSDEHIESAFCRSQEIPVAQIGPSHLEGGGDGMNAQDLAQRKRGALVEEDSQRGR